MNRITIILIIFIFLNCEKVLSQFIEPIKDGSIKMVLDQSGKVNLNNSTTTGKTKEDSKLVKRLKIIFGKGDEAPLRFALIKQDSYDFKITVEKPEESHKKFIKGLGTKYLNTYKILNDEFNPVTKLNKVFFKEDFKKIKNDLKELGEILSDDNPKARLESTINKFEFFHGKTFLNKVLFDSVFTISSNLSKIKRTKAFDADNVLEIDTLKSEDEIINLKVLVSDFDKDFKRKYFNESKKLASSHFKEITDTLSKITVEAFYRNSIDSITLLEKKFANLKAKIDKLNQALICDEDYNDYQNLQQRFANESNQYPINLLTSNWMKSLILLTDGNIKVNPFNFTDEEYLVLIEPDSVKAKVYDSYRDSVINLMLSSKILNEAKVDYAAFDRLLIQQNKGDEVFSYKVENEKLKKENKQNAEKFRLINKAIASYTFNIIENKEVKNNLFLNYDASVKLKGAFPKKYPTLSNKVKVHAIAYNLKDTLNFTIKETPTEIKDQSVATTQINQVADGLSLIGTQVPLGITALDFVKSASNKDKIIDKKNISFQDSSMQVNAKIMSVDKNIYKNKFEYKLDFRKRDLFILTITNIKNKKKSFVNISTKIINDQLAKSKVEKCLAFKDSLYNKINENKSSIVEDLNLYYKHDQEKAIDRLRSIINYIIKDLFENTFRDHQTIIVKEDVVNKLVIIEYVKSPAVYMLPPAKIEAKEDTSANFRNKIIPFATETKAMKKDAELMVVSKKTSAVIYKKKESFKTAPPHWLLPSIGLTYIYNPFRRSDATVTNGVVVNTPDEEQLRLIAGLHIHPYRVILANDHNVVNLAWNGHWKEVFSRLSLFTAVSFPKPLYNWHIGPSIDFWTGVKLSGGLHFYRYTGYTVLNNQITDQKSKYIYNHGFISLSIDPVSFGKLLGVIK